MFLCATLTITSPKNFHELHNYQTNNHNISKRSDGYFLLWFIFWIRFMNLKKPTSIIKWGVESSLSIQERSPHVYNKLDSSLLSTQQSPYHLKEITTTIKLNQTRLCKYIQQIEFQCPIQREFFTQFLQWLFSQTKMAGRSQSAEILSASNN